MKSDPFAPSAAIRLVDKMNACEKLSVFEKPTALDELLALDAKLGLKPLTAIERSLDRERLLFGAK